MADASPTLAPPDASAGRRERSRLGLARNLTVLSPHSSRSVALLKLLLPAIALTLLGLIVIWPQIKDDPGRFRLNAAKVDPGEAELIRMTNPRYVGLDSENQPFALTADSATQEPSNADLMRLVEPKADLTTKDGSWVALSAPAGMYDRMKQTLHLSGGVTVFQDAGYSFFSPSADIDLIVGSASGDEPVEGQGPFGHLTAAGFRILDRGHRVVFFGQSHLTIRGQGGPIAADKTRPPVRAGKGAPG